MYKCIDCGREFDEPESETVAWEDYYGVSSMFPDRHYGYITVCPFCGSEEFDEIEEEEEDE